MLGPKCYSLGDQVTYDLTELTVAINVASVTVSPSAHIFFKTLETVCILFIFSSQKLEIISTRIKIPLKPWRLWAQMLTFSLKPWRLCAY